MPLAALPSNASSQKHRRSLVPRALQDPALSPKCKQEGLHYIAARRKKRHHHWTYVKETAQIVEFCGATA
jgi:hypothetical protein